MAPPKPRQRRGFREVQRGFLSATSPDALFEAYGYACAFTGADLRAEVAADPHGYLVNLGNDLPTADPTLVIPACLDAIHAFERGHIAIGPRYNFLVDLERISPELLESLNPAGRLKLPATAALRPSLEALAAHRDSFAAGAFPPD